VSTGHRFSRSHVFMKRDVTHDHVFMKRDVTHDHVFMKRDVTHDHVFMKRDVTHDHVFMKRDVTHVCQVTNISSCKNLLPAFGSGQWSRSWSRS
jgi:hypothetical protein